MIPEFLKPFVMKLIDFTSAGRLIWTAGDEKNYTCSHNGYNLYLSQWFDDDSGDTTYSMTIENGENRAFFDAAHYETDFRVLSALFDCASSSAAKINDINNQFFIGL